MCSNMGFDWDTHNMHSNHSNRLCIMMQCKFCTLWGKLGEIEVGGLRVDLLVFGKYYIILLGDFI